MVMAPSATETYQEYKSNNLEKFEDYTVHADGDGSYRDAGYAKRLVERALKGKVIDVDGDTCEADEEDTFFVADLGEVYRQHLRWKLNLARVKPHYGERVSQ